MPALNSIASLAAVSLATIILLSGCVSSPRIGAITPRTGDEIVVAGHYIHTRTPVVLWTDPGGYDAYRVERRFAPIENSDWKQTQEEVNGLETPNRFNLRRAGLTPNEIEQVRGGGWDLETLQRVVDQFVLHFDVCGTSRECFNVLHDHRGLSVHFMLDLDGTIYQTLDLKERAWHATTSNHRSIGIEMANMGAYRDASDKTLAQWYAKDLAGRTHISIPERFGNGGIRTPNFVGRPARNEPLGGEVQGEALVQYDYTPEQYRALAHLTAALCKVFPKIKCDFPRAADGLLISRKLADDELDNYAGILGHYHIQTNKTDPGPAFNWAALIEQSRRLLGEPSPAIFRAPGLGHARQRH